MLVIMTKFENVSKFIANSGRVQKLTDFYCQSVYYTIIGFNEVDIRIYQPEKVIFTEAGGRGEYHF